jgi:hypothetical protein
MEEGCEALTELRPPSAALPLLESFSYSPVDQWDEDQKDHKEEWE